VGELAGHFLNITNALMDGTAVCDAIVDMASSVCAINSQSFVREHITRPYLFYSQTQIAVQANTSDSTVSRILFPDNIVRASSHTDFRMLALSSTGVFCSTACGLAGFFGGSFSGDSWYGVYGVGMCASSEFVALATFLFPEVRSEANTGINQLNSQFGGSNNWVYLGTVRLGENFSNAETVVNAASGGGPGNVIVQFVQDGNTTYFRNDNEPGGIGDRRAGIFLNHNSSTADLIWSVTKNHLATGSVVPTFIQSIRLVVSDFTLLTEASLSGTSGFLFTHSSTSIVKQEYIPIANSGIDMEIWTHLDESGTISVCALDGGTSGVKSLKLTAFIDPLLGDKDGR